MIEVYASRLSDGGKETYESEVSQTIAEWLYANGIDRDTSLEKLAISIYLNGDPLFPGQWTKANFSPSDLLEIYREPKGAFNTIFAPIINVLQAGLKALMPKTPNVQNPNTRSGKGLDEASAKGNKVKINQVRTECAGFNPARYPDYLIPPRRYFAGPFEQRVEMMLAITVGDCIAESVKIGQTPLLSLDPADADYTIYGPDADLSADPAHLFWYSAPEVGNSSTGAAGLELTVSSALTYQATASVFQFLDDTVAIPSGAGSFPADWTAGILLAIAAPYSYTVTNGTGTGGRDVITGPIAQLGLTAGDTIEIQGANAGQYVVFSIGADLQLNYAGGAPATGLTSGSTVVMAISFVGLRFRLLTRTAQLIQVERIKSDGVTVDTGWPGWDSLSSNQGQVRLDVSNLVGGYRGPFPACPPGEIVTKLEWDVFFATGLTGIGREGQIYGIPSSHVFEYRDMALGGAFTALTKTVNGGSLDAQGYTFLETLPYAMRPECRIRRLPTTLGRPEEAHDDSMWYGLRGLMATSSPISYEGMTTMSVNVRGGDRISSQSESLINLEVTRILPVLRSGVWGPAEPTREISAWVGHVARSVGYSDTTDIDIAELERLESTRWTPRGDTYDKIITEADTVKSNLLECLQAGFSELTIDRGLLVPVRDEPRGESFDHVYNPQVMLDPLSYEFTMPDQPDDFDGVDVEYFDHITKQNETVECRLPGDGGTRVKKVKIDGVGVRFRAWRIGMRIRRAQVYRQREYSFKTELDALNSAYFDYVALGVTTPGYGQSAEVVGYTAGSPVMLESSEPLDWSVAGVHKVLVRRKDGTASGPYVATRIDDYTFTIPILDFVPDLSGMIDTPPIIQFGHESKWCFPALITDVSPSGTRTCNVKAVNYDVRVYADDDNFPP